MNAVKPRRKLFELSHFNILLSMIVIFIHCSSIIMSGTQIGDRAFDAAFIPWRLSLFAVPGFIFLSGVKLFYNRSGKFDYIRFYRGRLTRVIIPYVVWVAIYYVYLTYTGEAVFSWSAFGHSLLYGDLTAHFYFVVIIAQFYILMPVWRFIFRRVTPSVAILFSALISIIFGYEIMEVWLYFFPNTMFNFSAVIFTKYLLYWTCGCYVGMNYARFKEAVLKRKTAITVLFILCAALNLYLSYKTYNVGVNWMEYVQATYCLSAILFVFAIYCKLCERSERLTKITDMIDSQCYNIFLSHCLVIMIAQDYLASIGITDPVREFWIVTLVTYSVPLLFWSGWYLIKTGAVYLARRIRARLKGESLESKPPINKPEIERSARKKTPSGKNAANKTRAVGAAAANGAKANNRAAAGVSANTAVKPERYAAAAVKAAANEKPANNKSANKKPVNNKSANKKRAAAAKENKRAAGVSADTAVKSERYAARRRDML